MYSSLSKYLKRNAWTIVGIFWIVITISFILICSALDFSTYSKFSGDSSSLNSEVDRNITKVFKNVTLSQKSNSYKLICYYNLPESENKLLPENIPHNLCTHINVAFAGISPENCSLHIPQHHLEIISRMSVLKLKNKNLKLIISVGGGGNNDFVSVVANHSNRIMFVNSTMQFLKKYEFDGVDIDWEWPVSDGNTKEKIEFVQLLREMREELDRHKKKYILSLAAAVLEPIITMAYYINYIIQYVDFINLMTYDYHFYTPYYPLTDFNAPLYSSALDNNSVFNNINVNFSVNYWISQSVPRDKIIMGIPTFGHTYKLISSLNHDLHSPANGFASVGSNGFILYFEVCQFLQNVNTIREFDDESQVPFAYKNYDWISYEDEFSAERKAEYIIEEKLGGAMIYSLNADDWRGVCRTDKETFPITRKVLQVLSSGNATTE